MAEEEARIAEEERLKKLEEERLLREQEEAERRAKEETYFTLESNRLLEERCVSQSTRTDDDERSKRGDRAFASVENPIG